MAKQLEKGSMYEQFDADGDGVVSDAEIARSERMIRIQNNDAKDDQIRKMAWVAIISLVGLIGLVLIPDLIPLSRLTTLQALLSTYTISVVGVVATFMATSAWKSSKE